MRNVSFQGEEKGRSINSVARQQLGTSVEPARRAKEAVVDDSQVKCSENGAEGAATWDRQVIWIYTDLFVDWTMPKKGKGKGKGKGGKGKKGKKRSVHFALAERRKPCWRPFSKKTQEKEEEAVKTGIHNSNLWEARMNLMDLSRKHYR